MAEDQITAAAENKADKSAPDSKGRKILSEILEWAETLVFGFFTVIILFTFIVREAYVDGDSMNETLQDRDKLIVAHLFYTPKAGDIVIINSENGYIYDYEGNLMQIPGLGKTIVKRVIATGGQTLDINFETGEVTVDGNVLEEPYIKDLTQRDEGGHIYPVTVPEGYVFVMGDNRMNSTDSRSSLVGFVPENDVLGKVIFRFLPFNSFGKVE